MRKLGFGLIVVLVAGVVVFGITSGVKATTDDTSAVSKSGCPFAAVEKAALADEQSKGCCAVEASAKQTALATDDCSKKNCCDSECNEGCCDSTACDKGAAESSQKTVLAEQNCTRM
ncbi:MAG: hypothetical protein C4527_03245 [Candidatus Omnitrophota bacterium]|jgi:hypothetical protein|nr:MAG: hypothetical protein C4527_03245 [Candidatus Omnitrophota bacterium]